MDIRQPVHSEHAKTLDTAALRRHFLIERIFVPGEITLTYSQIDRIIVGGICPTSAPLEFAPELGKHTGTDFFLERRELGLINIGGDAVVTIDGTRFDVKAEEALYIGKGARDVRFASVDPARPRSSTSTAHRRTRRTRIARSPWRRRRPKRWATRAPATGARSTSTSCRRCCRHASWSWA